MRSLKIVVCVLVLALTSPTGLLSQVHTAALTGLVTDPTGAVVPDARVTIKNKATNIEQSVSTDSSGYYTFASLRVGRYDLRVEKEGFKTGVADVVLEVAQKARQDFTLEVGAVAETVTVEATVPLLTTQEASTGAVVENRMVTDLPLSIRKWDDLLGLVAGVQGDRYTEEGGATAAGRTGGVNVHGVRSLQNNFLLDGVDNNSISTNVQELTTQILQPSVDSIQEFKITTNPYAAEYGRSPGAAISVTTKSGTKDFHGTAYWFVRNDIFDANNFFLNRLTNPLLNKKPKNRQNQFGGNIGGPIIKDRAFFFFNYEGTRIHKGVTRFGNVPLANERIGDFFAAPYTRMIDRVGDCVGAGNPFPNNQIPPGCIDPVAAAILALVPPPSFTGTGPLSNVSNFLRVPTLDDTTDSYTARGDWQINDKNNLFVRYTYFDRLRFVPGVFGGVLDGTSTSAFGRLFMKGQGAAIGWNRTIGTRMVNEFRLGWGRNNSEGVQDPFGDLPPTAAQIPNTPDDPLFNGGFPALRIRARGGTQEIPAGSGGGLDHIGSPVFLPKFQKTNQFQWWDMVNLSYGRHQIKFGADFRLPMRNIFLDVGRLRGDLIFDGTRTGVSMADFLLGYPTSVEIAPPSIVDARVWMMSYFFQDDWKFTPKLTVNLGFRYDFATWPYEGKNRMTNLNLATGRMFVAENAPLDASLATFFSTSTLGKSLVKSDKNNFAPRIGLAYQLTPRTVLRAGYGRFFMLFERAGSEDQMGLSLPWGVPINITALPNRTANDIRVRTGFNVSFNPILILADPVRLTGVRLRAVNPDAVMPTIDQWNLGIQRQLPGDIVATLDYVGTKGTHLSVLRNLNQRLFNPDGTPIVPELVLFPALGPIEFRDNMGNSNYHGLEVTVEKRFSRGLAFRGAYTWSKSIDYAMEHLFGGGTGSFTQNAHNIRGERRGRSDFDYRQRFVASYIYEPPVGRGRTYLASGPAAHILGGWRVSGITTMRTGRPFTIRAGGNDTAIGGSRGGGLVNALADCLRDGTLPENERTVDRWFDATAYAVPTPVRLGTCGRNTLTGPGLINFDFALARSFDYFGEGRSLEFRWEMLNMFNTPQFGIPERNRSSGSFGRISALAGDPRVMQFALKFNF